MDRLWAPWRLSYVTAARPSESPNPCFICTGLADTTGPSADRTNLIAHRTPLSVVVLNRFPYNNGHLLIAPREHKANLADLTNEEVLDTQKTLQHMVHAIDQIMHPDGYNIGLNLGRAAGAGLPGHLHWHLVPRWNGDTNFMPVFNDVRVIVQSLEALYDALTKTLQEGQ